MAKTIEVSDEQYAAWERGEPIEKVKRWDPPGGGYLVDALGMVGWVVHPSRSSLEFGTEYPTRELATRARDFMRIYHRLVAYALKHWPDYEPTKGRHAYYPRHIIDPCGDYWDVHFDTAVRNPWMPYGPRDKVEELVRRLGSGEVEL